MTLHIKIDSGYGNEVVWEDGHTEPLGLVERLELGINSRKATVTVALVSW